LWERWAFCQPDFVKVFPRWQVGGPDHVRALNAPLPHLPLIAAGGVTHKKRRQRAWIHELARRYKTMVGDARAQLAA
jgi:2-keto-3-deoxy-6-phosphogluconate aldolase